ncbi:MAG: hypothetical protein HRU41_34860 [Saprospiraceae bacterium]|nr:hypothetical protein [Saprospiraceae bacterium]
MKNRFLIWGVVLFGLLLACQRSTLTSSNLDPSFIKHEQVRYQVGSEAELSALITVLSGVEGIWVENIQCQEMNTMAGTSFLAITADYLDDDKKTSLLIPLTRSSEGEVADYTISCMMACATEITCQEQRFEIIQPCRELNCGCEIGDGGGSGALMFY